MSGEDKCEYIFTWRIKNYSACFYENGKWIESPIFSVENLFGSQWHLLFYPKGTKKYVDSFACYLKWLTSDGNNKTPPIEFNIAILNGVDSEVSDKHGASHVFSNASPSWGWPKFMPINKLAEEMDSWKDDVLTLRCRIKFDAHKKQVVFGSEACTVIDVDRRIFEWHVTKPMLPKHSESALFPISDIYNFEITLTSLVEGLNILIHLKEHNSDLFLPIIFKISFCTKGGKTIFKRAKHLFQDMEMWKFPEFLTKNLLEASHFDSSTDGFQLKFEIYASKQKISVNSVEKVHLKSLISDVDAMLKVSPITAMQKDFRSLLDDKEYFDVTIRAGNEEFTSHKLVLRVRSPVFKAMFDQNMLENVTNIVNVTDVDGQTMKTFLKYLYTDTVEKIDLESAQKLLIIADKYQVPSLVDVCASFLKSVLSVENACEIIATADSVNCAGLKSCAFDYIISNADKILMSSIWEQWIRENIDLATKILSKLSIDLTRRCKCV